MSSVERAIRSANASGRPALAAFLTAGFPERRRFPAILDAVAREADLVEIGVPFSDPLADGVTIQRASHAALRAGVTLGWILGAARETHAQAPLLLMSYVNPLLAYGFERLAREAAASGIAGLIVPDLPLEECPPLAEPLAAAGLDLVQLVTPVTPAARLARLCAASAGFVYAVTGTGTTGGRRALIPETLAYLDRVRRVSALPVLAGFGIRDADQLRALARHADGAIVGSALVEVVESGRDPAAFVRALRPAGNQD